MGTRSIHPQCPTVSGDVCHHSYHKPHAFIATSVPFYKPSASCVTIQKVIKALLSFCNFNCLIVMNKLPPAKFFPPAEVATEDGLVGMGGSLEPEWILDAYTHGIFPWPIGELDEPMLWWSLDPRAIIELDAFHISRRLQRTCRGSRFTVTCDQDFTGVIHGCATDPSREGGTWITPAMIGAYTRMFELGHVHSIEAWHEGRLAGGIYGIAINGLFAAESMFFKQRDASKVALVGLLNHLRARGYVLFDIQQLTPHSQRFGAVEIPRREYLRRLADALQTPTTFGQHLITEKGDK